MNVKSSIVTHVLKISFFIMLIVAWLYFIIGQLLMPSDIPQENDSCSVFIASWEQIFDDGSRLPVDVPGRCSAQRDERIVITTTIPSDATYNTCLCFRSNKQDMEIYVDGQLRQQYSTDDTRVFGKMTVSMYVILELEPNDAGKTLTLVTQSDSSYSGIFNTVYYGTKTGIFRYIIRNNSLELGVALLMGIFGIICILCSIALQYYYKRKVSLRYLALAVVQAAMWLIANSELRQFIFPNVSVLNDMAFLMILAIPAPIVLYMNEIQGKRYQKYYNIVLSVNIVVFVACVALHLLNIRELADNFMYMALDCFISVIVIGITIVFDIRSGAIRKYGLIAIGISGACLAGILQIILYLNRTIPFSGVLISIGLIFLLIVAASNTIAEVIRSEQEKRQAISAGEAKTKFLASMSHEIRTPINAVIGLNEMILRESKEDGIREYALKIQNASRSLVEDINDVLDLSKIESGKMNIIPQDYQLADLVSSMVDMITLRAQNKGLELKVSLDEKLPSMLYGDDVRLRQIITNLLTNAVKYTPEGVVELVVGGTVKGSVLTMHVEVRDTGIGIKEEDISRLFADYERIEENRNRNIEGTGLGIGITQKLLSMMGSELKVKSKYGKGSVFSFDLKQEIKNTEPVGDISEKMSKQIIEYSYTPTFVAPKAKILVVDDIEVNRYVIKNLLKETKIQVADADSGEKCLKMIQSEHFDLIFLDHMMPRMDGIETLKRMKALKDSKCIGMPVIALTSNALAGSKEFYIEVGFDDYLSKPIKQDKLEKLLYEKLPKELLEEYIAESKSDAVRQEPEELPQIEGIDWQYAMVHFKDEKLMLATLENVYYSLESQADRLDELSESKSLEDYRILVHSVKGVTAMSGMTAISGVAAALEQCAADKDEEKICTLNSWLTEQMRKMKIRLDVLFVKDTNKKVIEDYNVMLALLEMIRMDAFDMDIDGLDEKTAQLMEYEYPAEILDIISQLKINVTELNEDGINQSVDSLEAYFRKGGAHETESTFDR